MLPFTTTCRSAASTMRSRQRAEGDCHTPVVAVVVECSQGPVCVVSWEVPYVCVLSCESTYYFIRGVQSSCTGGEPPTIGRLPSSQVPQRWVTRNSTYHLSTLYYVISKQSQDCSPPRVAAMKVDTHTMILLSCCCNCIPSRFHKRSRPARCNDQVGQGLRLESRSRCKNQCIDIRPPLAHSVAFIIHHTPSTCAATLLRHRRWWRRRRQSLRRRRNTGEQGQLLLGRLS